MNSLSLHFTTIILLFMLSDCQPHSQAKQNTEIKHHANHENILLSGRFETIKNSVALISPGAMATVHFTGNHCQILLNAEKQPYNYVSFVLDGKHLGRTKIDYGAPKPYTLNVDTNKTSHTLQIIKESEASNGHVLFSGILVDELLKIDSQPKKNIEFIGDSITCGAASDGSVTPCNEGEYFDNQNVYNSYGAILARTLNVNFTLSSVSGIGMYRNWNDENINEPIMPQVYENLYLDTNNSKPFGFSNPPEIVSICLGTNDLSKGDGTKPRLAFNTEKYTENYINFIKTVYAHYPNTQIVLLNSPMVAGEENTLLISCLKEVQQHFTNTKKPIQLFQFNKTYTNGCMWHPSTDEHKQIAQVLTPFFQKLLK